MINFEEEVTTDITVDDLKNITKLATMLAEKQAELARLKGEAKVVEATIRRLEEEHLPAAMKQLGGVGMSSFTMGDGRKLELLSKLYMSVPKKSMPSVCEWLKAHQHGSLVRTQLAADFGAGEAERADALYQLLEANGIDHIKRATTVNTTSLKAAVSEMLENGVDVPLELMGGYEREYVEIKQG